MLVAVDGRAAGLVAVSDAIQESPPEAVRELKAAGLKIMTCAVCPITVKKSLKKVSGVSAVKVDFARKTAVVTYDPDQTKPEALTRATTDAVYPATVRK